MRSWASKGLYAPDVNFVKSTKSEVRRAGIRLTCKFSITRKRKKGKEKWTETASTSMCTLICTARPHLISEIFSGKECHNFWAPHRPPPPRIAGSEGSVVTPLVILCTIANFHVSVSN